MRTWREEWDFLHGRPERPIPQYESSDPVREISDSAKLCADPLVSVVVTIYNHEKWLDECIGSVIEQRSDFKYEVLLCEDCSTDSSLDIAKNWQRRFPDRVRVLYWEYNTGGSKNGQMGIAKARGKYIAWLEGDDYWIDQFKLQKQMDLIESGKYRMVVALNDICEEATGKIRQLRFPMSREITLADAPFIYYHTSTYLIEKVLREEMQEWLRWIPAYDTVIFRLAVSLCGRIGVLNDKVSIYRRTGRGIYTSMSLSVKGEQGVCDAVLFLRHSPGNIKALARHNYCAALLNYVTYTNYDNQKSIKRLIAVLVATCEFPLACGRRTLLFLFGSMIKSFFAKRSYEC